MEWLGIDCIWMLPFYPSPLRDGGYDISDFFNVHPDYGSISDLVAFLEDAHRRGIRVVADLVMNHTSDEHPWFIESRSSRDNAKADWYVWNEDDQKWPDARVVFTDVERSNWTWDDTRQQYYWHRFYHHQPDLNYENPEVADTMIDLVRFWLDLGFDGFRLDAVPYLYQRDGTSGEHLPETHAFIKRIRKQIDADYPGRILLAEANGWPSDVADYFGDGDECHLCFHFPLMPRLFMAVRREQRYPITEILAQTPVIDDSCQWAIFLRNHDELTLEQVSDEERDYLIAEYAKDPRMKRHMGIGRRLAPLIDNDRRTAELLYALILSLPGSPVIYYGDELLMGDNIYLGDRDSVRTPMQWSPDRNGGFSKADFAQLYLPPLMDPVYGFSVLNVEAQLRNQGSFLHWLRRMLTERRALPVMGVGAMEVLPCANPSVLAYMRSGEVADILTASTSTGPSVSPAAGGALDWGRSTVLARTVPAGNESEGDEAVYRHQAVLCVHNLSRFAQPAELALAKWAGSTPYEVLGRVPFPVITEEPYAVTLPPYGFLWFDLVLEEVGAGVTAERDQSLRTLIEAWLGLRRNTPAGEIVLERAEVLLGGRPGLIDIVARVGERRAHFVAGLRGVADEPHFLRSGEEAALGLLDDEEGLAVCTDALRDAQLAALLLATVRGVEARPGPVAVLRDDDDATVLDCGDRGDLLVFPWLDEEPRPDVDLMVALDESGFNHVAAPLVRWVWEGSDLGVVQEPLADRSGGWALALTSLRDFYASGGSPEVAGGDFGAEARALGTMTARMHLALDAAFHREHEPVVDWIDSAETTIAESDPSLLAAPGVTELVKWLRESEARLPVIRTHGDFHLGPHGADGPGMGGQRLRAGRRPRPGVHGEPAHPPRGRGGPAVVDAPRQHGRSR